jgi:hypothetical protein
MEEYSSNPDVENIIDKWLSLQKIIKEEITLNDICKSLII